MDKVEDVEVSKEEVKPEDKSKEVKPKEVAERYNLVEVPTETGIFVKDNKTEKILNQLDLLVEMSNKLDKIEKAVA